MMPRRFLLLMAAALVSSACSASSSEFPFRIIGGSGESEPVLTIARGNGAAKVCAGRGLPAPDPVVLGEPVPLYPARGVFAVTHSMPFSTTPEQAGNRCDLTLQGEPLIAADGAGEKLAYARCSILFRASQGDVLIAPNETPRNWEDRYLLAECVYRLVMYVEGYRGALAEPADTLFANASESFLLAGRPYIGPSAPTLPRHLSLRCPQLEQLYYRDNLAETLQTQCPAALESFNLKR